MITGAMKTFVIGAIETMANLIPFHLLVDKHQQHGAAWLATLPKSHPLHKSIQNAANKLVKRHPTPLHNLMHKYNIQPTKMETFKATQSETNWKLNIKINIASSINKAIEDIQNDNPDVKVFMDGSGMDGKIGAAMVLYRNGRLKTKVQHQLGSQ